jgi:hypothetical protein
MILVGCSTTDESTNARPWNTPQTWETGLPSSMLNGR